MTIYNEFLPVERHKLCSAWQDSGDPLTTMVLFGFMDSINFMMDSPSDRPSKSIYWILALIGKVVVVEMHLVGHSAVSG